MFSLNEGWQFSENWSEDFMRGKGDFPVIRIPHTNKLLPYHNIDEKSYQMICGYRRTIDLREFADSSGYVVKGSGAATGNASVYSDGSGGSFCFEGKRIFLQFDAAAHIATVYINGQERMTHSCGYTAFRVELTDDMKDGSVDVAVRLDTTENPKIPPFGFVIDYLTYGGIYRPVWLDITDRNYVSDIFVYTPDLNTAVVEFETVEDEGTKHERIILIKDSEGRIIAESKSRGNRAEIKIDSAKPWNLDNPQLYTYRVELENVEDERGNAGNSGKSSVNLSGKEVSFGFRTAEFKQDGFYLNGEKIFLRGLNRHQSYPYIGYAAVDSLQKEDARILKEELACNAVRTSHYPQSQAFIDACDRAGLLVFTEIPGWQHIGDDVWKKQAVENTKEMILQYRNHPSVILWGVRINESQDDDEFYAKTNALARSLDPSRQISGVRNIEKSNCLEDVYAYNDFSHDGSNSGVKAKKKILRPGQMDKPLLISECNGHMFPTKPFDKWEVRQEHALRHARVMNDAIASGEHAGIFEWCMFDYPTHRDFGSGDRVCYHGVLDGFRNPKIAAAVWSSQGENCDVLEVSSSMDIGDYPAGQLGDVYVFSNADTVKLYKNGQYVAELNNRPYNALKHSPLLVDDTVGELLKVNEGFSGSKERTIHRCLISARRHGVSNMPLADKLRFAKAMLVYGLKYSQAVELFGKYVGNWGAEATVWKFEGIKDGRVVSAKELSPNTDMHIEVKVSSSELCEAGSYDMAMVRVRILNAYDNIQPYVQLPVFFEASGAVALAGPSAASAEGGMTGTFVKTKGESGSGNLKVSCEGCAPVEIKFTVKA